MKNSATNLADTYNYKVPREGSTEISAQVSHLIVVQYEVKFCPPDIGPDLGISGASSEAIPNS